MAKYRALEEEVARLEVALTQAEAERDDAREQLAVTRAELDRTLEDLDEQIALTARAERQRDTWKRASNENLWTAFVQGTKVKLCERGTRKGLDRCQEGIEGVFDELARDRFDHCVASKGAVPTLVQIDRGIEPPAYSEPLPESRQMGKGWYVVYCDPDLPEAAVAGDDIDADPTVIRMAQR